MCSFLVILLLIPLPVRLNSNINTVVHVLLRFNTNNELLSPQTSPVWVGCFNHDLMSMDKSCSICNMTVLYIRRHVGIQ